MTNKPLSVLCVIDHLGPGGAQRQMTALACALKEHGHSVEIFLYFPDQRFFRPIVDRSKITVHEATKGKGFSLSVFWALVNTIRRRKYDVVVSYLGSPNVYTELCALVTRSSKFIVSERSSFRADRSRVGALVRRWLHALADHVVTNSHEQAQWLRGKSWLVHKVTCIYNGLDLESFDPTWSELARDGEDVRLLGIGRIGPEKNLLHLIEAMCLLEEEGRRLPFVSWVGRQDASENGLAYRAKVDDLLARRPKVASHWKWLGERDDVVELLAQHHALIHPSFYEGLPNVVCEAMAAGRPALVSRVCDHPVLILDGQRGFLFNPDSPPEIARAIDRFAALSTSERLSLGRNARAYAAANLSIRTMVGAYGALFSRLLDDSPCNGNV
ncbi:MAG: glycosyltransferase family 4 protein [Rubrivivax sp.]|nr:glycosyltransferase family 4 protein [Rubrivivax sp.]